VLISHKNLFTLQEVFRIRIPKADPDSGRPKAMGIHADPDSKRCFRVIKVRGSNIQTGNLAIE
jgi:hypothetical protein